MLSHPEQLAAIERMVAAVTQLIGEPAARELAGNVVATLALDDKADPQHEIHEAVLRRWRGDPYRVRQGKRPIKMPEVAPCFCAGLTTAHVVDLQDRLAAAWFVRSAPG